MSLSQYSPESVPILIDRLCHASTSSDALSSLSSLLECTSPLPSSSSSQSISEVRKHELLSSRRDEVISNLVSSPELWNVVFEMLSNNALGSISVEEECITHCCSLLQNILSVVNSSLLLSVETSSNLSLLSPLLDLLTTNQSSYLRILSMQVLLKLHTLSPHLTQDSLLAIPDGLNQLISLLSETTPDQIRNEAILFITSLARSSPAARKFWIYQEGLEKALGIALSEGGLTRGSVICRDCLDLSIALMTKDDPSGDVLFGSRDCMEMICGFLDLRRGEAVLFAEDKIPDEDLEDLLNGNDANSKAQKTREIQKLTATEDMIVCKVLELLEVATNDRVPTSLLRWENVLRSILTIAVYQPKYASPVFAAPSPLVQVRALSLLTKVGHSLDLKGKESVLNQTPFYLEGMPSFLTALLDLCVSDNALSEYGCGVLREMMVEEWACLWVLHAIAPPPEDDRGNSSIVSPLVKIAGDLIQGLESDGNRGIVPGACWVLGIVLHKGGIIFKEMLSQFKINNTTFLSLLLSSLENHWDNHHQEQMGIQHVLWLLALWTQSCPTAATAVLSSPESTILPSLLTNSPPNDASLAMLCIFVGNLLAFFPTDDLNPGGWTPQTLLETIRNTITLSKFTHVLDHHKSLRWCQVDSENTFFRTWYALNSHKIRNSLIKNLTSVSSEEEPLSELLSTQNEQINALQLLVEEKDERAAIAMKEIGEWKSRFDMGSSHEMKIIEQNIELQLKLDKLKEIQGKETKIIQERCQQESKERDDEIIELREVSEEAMASENQMSEELKALSLAYTTLETEYRNAPKPVPDSASKELELQAEIHQLQSCGAEKDAWMAMAMERIQMLGEQNNALSNDLGNQGEHGTALAMARQRILELEGVNGTLVAEKDQMRKECDGVKTQVGGLKKEIENANNTNATVMQEGVSLRKEKETLQASLQATRQKHSELFDAQSAELDHLGETVENLHSDKKEWEEIKTSLQLKNIQLTESQSHHEKQVQVLKDRLHALETELTCTRDNAMLAQQGTNNHEKIAKQLPMLEEKIRSLSTQLEKADQMTASLRDENKSLQVDASSATRGDWTDELVTNKGKKDSELLRIVQSENEELIQKVELLETDVRVLKVHKRNAMKSISSLEQDRDKLKEIKTSNTMKRDFAEELLAANKKKEDAEQFRVLLVNNEELSKKNRELWNTNHQLEKQLQDLETSNLSTYQEKEQIKYNETQARERQNTLEDLNRIVQVEKETLQRNLASLQQNNHITLVETEGKIAYLEQKLTNSEQEIGTLRQTLSNKDAQDADEASLQQEIKHNETLAWKRVTTLEDLNRTVLIEKETLQRNLTSLQNNNQNTLDETEEKISLLQQKLTDSEQEISSVRQTLQQKDTELREQLKDLPKDDSSELLSQIQTLTTENNLLQNETEEHVQQLESLKEKLTEYQVWAGTAQEKIGDLSDERDAEELKSEEITEKLTMIQEEKEALALRLEGLLKDTDQTKLEKEEEERKSKEMMEELTLLRGEKEGLELRLGGLEEDTEQAKLEKKELFTLCETLDSKVKNLEDKANVSKIQTEERLATFFEMSGKQVELAREENEALTYELKTVSTDLDDVKKELDGVHIQSAEVVNQWKERLEISDSTLQDLENQMLDDKMKMEQQCKEAGEAISAWESRCAFLMEEQEECMNKMEEMEDTNAGLAQECVTIKEEFAEMNRSVAEKQILLEELKSEKAENDTNVEDEISFMTKELNEMKEQSEEVVNKWKERTEELESSISTLKQLLEEQQIEADSSLKEQQDQANLAIAEWEKQCSALHEQLEEHEGHLDESEDRIGTLESDLEETWLQLDAATSQVAKMDHEMRLSRSRLEEERNLIMFELEEKVGKEASCLATLQVELNIARSSSTDLQNALGTLTQEHADLESKLDIEKAARLEADATVSLEAQVRVQVEKSLEECRITISDLENKLKNQTCALEEKTQRWKIDSLQYEKQDRKMESEMTDMQAVLGKFSGELQERETTLRALSTDEASSKATELTNRALREQISLLRSDHDAAEETTIKEREARLLAEKHLQIVKDDISFLASVGDIVSVDVTLKKIVSKAKDEVVRKERIEISNLRDSLQKLTEELTLAQEARRESDEKCFSLKINTSLSEQKLKTIKSEFSLLQRTIEDMRESEVHLKSTVQYRIETLEKDRENLIKSQSDEVDAWRSEILQVNGEKDSVVSSLHKSERTNATLVATITQTNKDENDPSFDSGVELAKLRLENAQLLVTSEEIAVKSQQRIREAFATKASSHETVFILEKKLRQTAESTLEDMKIQVEEMKSQLEQEREIRASGLEAENSPNENLERHVKELKSENDRLIGLNERMHAEIEIIKEETMGKFKISEAKAREFERQGHFEAYVTNEVAILRTEACLYSKTVNNGTKKSEQKNVSYERIGNSKNEDNHTILAEDMYDIVNELKTKSDQERSLYHDLLAEHEDLLSLLAQLECEKTSLQVALSQIGGMEAVREALLEAEEDAITRFGEYTQ